MRFAGTTLPTSLLQQLAFQGFDPAAIRAYHPSQAAPQVRYRLPVSPPTIGFAPQVKHPLLLSGPPAKTEHHPGGSFREFESLHSQELKARIAQMAVTHHDYFLKNIETLVYLGKIPSLSESQTCQRVYEMEMRFCQHILQTVEDMLQNPDASQDTTSPLAILFDVDGTLGGSIFSEFEIRPSFTLLADYLKQRYPRLRLGICSSRRQSDLLRQLQGANRGKLHEIAPLIDTDLIYSSRDVDSRPLVPGYRHADVESVLG